MTKENVRVLTGKDLINLTAANVPKLTEEQLSSMTRGASGAIRSIEVPLKWKEEKRLENERCESELKVWRSICSESAVSLKGIVEKFFKSLEYLRGIQENGFSERELHERIYGLYGFAVAFIQEGKMQGVYIRREDSDGIVHSPSWLSTCFCPCSTHCPVHSPWRGDILHSDYLVNPLEFFAFCSFQYVLIPAACKRILDHILDPMNRERDLAAISQSVKGKMREIEKHLKIKKKRHERVQMESFLKVVEEECVANPPRSYSEFLHRASVRVALRSFTSADGKPKKLTGGYLRRVISSYIPPELKKRGRKPKAV